MCIGVVATFDSTAVKMAGILQLGESHGGDITASFNREVVVKALQWLRKNNPIYSDFRLKPCMPISHVPLFNSVGTPFPTVTSDLQVGSGKQLTVDDIKNKEGMIILADPTEQLSLGQLKPSEADKLLERAGVESRRVPEDSQLGELCRSHHLSLNDPSLIRSCSLTCIPMEPRDTTTDARQVITPVS